MACDDAGGARPGKARGGRGRRHGRRAILRGRGRAPKRGYAYPSAASTDNQRRPRSQRFDDEVGAAEAAPGSPAKAGKSARRQREPVYPREGGERRVRRLVQRFIPAGAGNRTRKRRPAGVRPRGGGAKSSSYWLHGPTPRMRGNGHKAPADRRNESYRRGAPGSRPSAHGREYARRGRSTGPNPYP